jgi:glycosyltransferase involved in cell wall biosynthesis
MSMLVQSRHDISASSSILRGKRVAMITFSPFPADPRPRRAVEVLLQQGMAIELICLEDEGAPRREKLDNLEIIRLPITKRRGGFASYVYQYLSFIAASGGIVGARALNRPYDLVYIHNMPDILVVSSLLPKLRGARVILDMHDPMPELMTTIFGLENGCLAIRVLRRLEKWSMARADAVLTVNSACKRVFASRSCPSEKIGIVMNSPDDELFPFRSVGLREIESGVVRPFVMMYHGSIVERNGLDLAIRALGKVRKNIPGAELRIYGRSTPFLERVLDEARHYGVHESVTYMGPRPLEALAREIGRCDIGIIPNQRSAFTDINTPTRIFEYLSQGKPAVVPRTPGILDYFSEPSILFFEAGNAEDLAATLEYVALHPRESSRAAERWQLVYLRHCWRVEQQALINVVSEVLTAHSRRLG